MRIEPLRPLGARVGDVDLTAPSDDDVAALREALAAHGVLVLPGRGLDDDAFVAFLSRFGELAFTAGETHVEGHPDLNVVSNVGRTTPPRSSFHVDTSYVRRPPAYTALRAVQVPAHGGETLFTDQRAAFRALPDALREHLAGRTVRHVVTGVDPGAGEETEAEHPLFRRHPVSGETTLFLTTAARCRSISGMDDAEAERTIADLLARSTVRENTYRHAWSPGDVVMWDNAVVLHKADHAGVDGDRVMHRGMVAGTDVPQAAAV